MKRMYLMGRPNHANGEVRARDKLWQLIDQVSKVFCEERVPLEGQGSVEGIGTSKSSISHKSISTAQDLKIMGKCIGDHEAGLKKVMDLLQQPQNVCAVGHRVVHGGEQFSKSTHITQEGIRVAEELFHCPHVAVFDTPPSPGRRTLHKSMGLAEINALLNKESGIYGICRIRKYLGAYIVDLEGKVDALVFSGGVGERSAKMRSMVCERLEAFGIQVDEEKNGKSLREIHKDGSRIKVLVIPTNEQLCIAQQTREVLESLESPVCEKKTTSGG
ncbi:hypothetical protein SELMODRAFT_431820 [Selaginella moellendorffii]|uniref:Acetate kinase n=1 Tax=Selaginella moellendorffii TaxID=88036 RepID=D8TDX3_SELML|nr:hypothetical protein SELMODRAFT_431820 [Selaginella moellendorffii]